MKKEGKSCEVFCPRLEGAREAALNEEKCFLDMNQEEKIRHLIKGIAEEDDRAMRLFKWRDLKGYLDRLFHPDAFI